MRRNPNSDLANSTAARKRLKVMGVPMQPERRRAGTALLTEEERSANLLRNTPSYISNCSHKRLETWSNPTLGESEFTVDNLREACVRAGRRNSKLRAARLLLVSPSEEQLRQIEEQDRKFLMVALGVYTKAYNMQPTELEFVQVKERNLIDENGAGYLHFNFLVKGLDDKTTMYFAEVHHDLEDENDVFLCMPLGEDDLKPSEKSDQALCRACQNEAKDLIHPSCGSFLGGRRGTCWPLRLDISDDDDSDYEII